MQGSPQLQSCGLLGGAGGCEGRLAGEAGSGIEARISSEKSSSSDPTATSDSIVTGLWIAAVVTTHLLASPAESWATSGVARTD